MSRKILFLSSTFISTKSLNPATLTVEILGLHELLSGARDPVELPQERQNVENLQSVELLALDRVEAELKLAEVGKPLDVPDLSDLRNRVRREVQQTQILQILQPFQPKYQTNIDSLSQLILAQIEDPQFGEVVQAGNRDQLVAVQVELGEVQALDPGDGRDVVV